jgi:hypothetical protein
MSMPEFRPAPTGDDPLARLRSFGFQELLSELWRTPLGHLVATSEALKLLEEIEKEAQR